MLLALTLTLLSAAPATGLTLSSKLGKEATPVAAFLDAIEQELIAGKRPVRRLTLSCDGKRECLLAGAREAGVPSLVAVTVAYGKKQTTLDLEAVRTLDGATLSQLTFSVTGRLSEADRASLRKFAAQLDEALREPKTDAPLATPPVVVVGEPPPAPKPAVVVTQPVLTPVRSRVPAWVMGGGAVAGVVTSGVFLGLATGARSELEKTPDPSPLTRAQADGLAARANTDYSVALAAGLAAGALATGAILWLVTE